MKSTKHFLTAFFLLTSFYSIAQSVPPITLNITTAGTLPSLITSTEKEQITNLTLTGNINEKDISYICEMAGRRDINGNSANGKLSVLNLSKVNIVYSGNSYYTSSNKIGGECSFSGCTRLTSITMCP